MKDLIKKVKEVNESPFVMGEGIKTFNIKTFRVLRELLLKRSNEENGCLSTNEKIQIQCFVYRGELFNKVTDNCGKTFRAFLPIQQLFGMQCVVDHLFGFGHFFEKIYHQPFNGNLMLDIEGFDNLLSEELKWRFNREIREHSWKSVRMAKILFEGIDIEKLLK